MILILDDDPRRHRAFRQQLIGATVRHAQSAAGAIDALARYHPNVLCLDYDLNQFGADARDVGTGMDVVDWLVAHSQRATLRLIAVHSLNPFYAPRMVARLRSARYNVIEVPGAWTCEPFCQYLVGLDQRA